MKKSDEVAERIDRLEREFKDIRWKPVPDSMKSYYAYLISFYEKLIETGN